MTRVFDIHGNEVFRRPGRIVEFHNEIHILEVAMCSRTTFNDYYGNAKFETVQRFSSDSDIIKMTIDLGSYLFLGKIKEQKPIKFKRSMNSWINKNKIAFRNPNDYENIQLVQKGNNNMSLMLAWDRDKEDGVLYIGYWNGGYVEDQK